MRNIINLVERVQDRNIWYNTRTQSEVSVREGALVQTVRDSRHRFGLSDEFVERNWSEPQLVSMLLARHWVHTEVMAGATIVRAATIQNARAALRTQYLHVPIKSVLVEVGLNEITHREEFTGEEAVKKFVRGE